MRLARMTIGGADLSELDKRIIVESLQLRAAIHRGQLGLAGQLLDMSARGTAVEEAAKGARGRLEALEAQLVPVVPWKLEGDAARCQLLVAGLELDGPARAEASRALEGS